MNIKIQRNDPGAMKPPWVTEHTVPFREDEGYTVMDALEYIFSHDDPTLAFFSHAACNHGICGRCGVKVNGKVKLACLELLTGDETFLEPKNHNVIKDLVCK